MRLETGYVKASELVYRAFTIVVSAIALVVAAPLLLAVAVAILVVDGRPVFYASTRLGKGKRPFRMYKFRTLVPEADARIGAEFFRYALSSNRALLTRTGRFLRETRLDELPQLVNTLIGDMDLLGPRPIRPDQYEQFCRNIRGFDRLFCVRPGLVGYAQIFTPHSAPKRMRALIDQKFLRRKHRYGSELFLLVSSLGLIAFKLARRVLGGVVDAARRTAFGREERRVLDRHSPHGVTVVVRSRDEPAAPQAVVDLVDANEEALAVVGAHLPDGPLDLEIRIPVETGAQRKVTKIARCTGTILTEHEHLGPAARGSVVKYVPRSPLNYYVVHQYLMEGSILNLHGSGIGHGVFAEIARRISR